METVAFSGDAETFRKRLMAWYDEHRRDLPWRREPSLYKTVVSEFMLQQTQVKTALPYFDAWLRRYPDFAALAAASEDEILKSWEGLGYYTRARNLHKLARQLAALPPSSIPQRADDWLAFPGIGPYAAAAVCSIVFGDAAAVVDGNVIRILARLSADTKAYPNGSEAAKSYRKLAAFLLNPERPGDHNQAMMELGATLCRKHAPQCLLCPVRDHCQGRADGIAESLPRLARTAIDAQLEHRAWILSPKGLLLRRIPDTATRMRGLHELPRLSELGLAIPKGAPLLERKRSITRYRISERIHAVSSDQLPSPLPEHCLWASPVELDALAFSGPHRRWIEELLAQEATA